MEKPSIPNPDQNLYETSRDKKVFREALKDEKTPESVKKIANENLHEIKDGLSGLIEKEGGIAKVKERFKKEKTESERLKKSDLDEKAIAEAMGEKAAVYEKLGALSEELESLRIFEMKRSLEIKSDPYAARANEKLVEKAREEIKEKETELGILKEGNPNETRAHEFVEYAEGLSKEGHIAPTNSVKENLQRIGRNMMLGKPMFLHGPTGTGKTSIARLAAFRFMGKDPEIVYCNPQTRETNIWGRTGIRPPEKGEKLAKEQISIITKFIAGPLTKAMQEGKAFIFDEFTALPPEIMVLIKGPLAHKPGDMVAITGDDKVKLAPGFQMIVTANLKSEKNPERHSLPPEIAREFEQNNLKIDYLPKNESYDVMLARLMERDGSVNASWLTLNETLPKLAEAIEEIEIAYTGVLSSETARITGSMDASGKVAGLKKFVMTQGTVEAIILDWKMEKSRGRKISFAEHIDNRLKIALTFEEYPLADRILAAKILASKGFLRTLTPKELNLPQDIFNFDAAKKLRGDKEAIQKFKEKSGKEINIPLKELSELDPFRIRKPNVAEEARKLAEEAAGRRRESDIEGEVSLEKARETMKENFLGPEQIEKAFGFTPENIPPIPFSSEELARAKELNQILILQVEHDEENRPLTMQSMNEKVGSKAADGNNLLMSIDWYKNDPFFTTEPVSAGWKLVSKEIIPETKSKNYLEQTEALINRLKTEVFENQPLPQEYEEAIHEFEREKNQIAAIIDSDWKTAADKLANLKITNLLRESAPDLLYRLIVQEKQNNQKLLGNIWSWTKSRSSSRSLVYVGCFGTGGASVRRDAPGYRHDYLGSVFSRVK